MEIRAFYGESGLRNFEARNYMEKLDLDKMWIWRIYGDLDFFFQYEDSGLSHFEAPLSSQVFLAVLAQSHCSPSAYLQGVFFSYFFLLISVNDICI